MADTGDCPVTVVIPLYNKAAEIGRCLTSIRNQTRPGCAVVVVDDGSTDGSAEAARPHLGPGDQLVAQANAGAQAARNRGAELAQTDLVAFLDADDEWLPEFLEVLLGLHERFPEAGAYATSYRMQRPDGQTRTPSFREVPTSEEGGLIESYLRCAVEGRSPLCCSAVAFHKEALLAIGGFPSGISWGGDLDTWIRAALRYPVAWTPKPGALYHLDAGGRVSLSHRTGDYPPAERTEEYARAAGDAETARLLREFLVRKRLEMIGHNWRAGDAEWVQRLLGLCAETQRFRLWWWKWRLRSVLLPMPVRASAHTDG